MPHQDTTPVRRFHSCRKCTWYRDLVVLEKDRAQVWEHPLYGRVTLKAMADLDVERHDCDAHQEAVRRARAARRLNRWSVDAKLRRDLDVKGLTNELQHYLPR